MYTEKTERKRDRNRDTHKERNTGRENACTRLRLQFFIISRFLLAQGLASPRCEMEWARVHDLLLMHEVLGAKECNELRSSCQSNHRLEGFYTECLADHADGISLKYPLGSCQGRLDGEARSESS